MGRVRFSERILSFGGCCCCLLTAALFAGASVSTYAQDATVVKFRAQVTAVEPPDAFDVPGYHVVMTKTTELASFYKLTKDLRELRQAIAVGAVVDVQGVKDSSGHMVTAARIVVHDNADQSDQKVSGFGVIDRMFSGGAQPAFRADGYMLRVNPQTHVEFSGTLTALSQVGTNTWIEYKGFRTPGGDVLLTWVNFIKPKLKAPKRAPQASLAQATSFPPGSIIDFDGSFRTDGNDHRRHKIEDMGGTCGWYPVSSDAALQRRVQRVGASVIPQYQRDLPEDDPSKIPYRFYAVEEKNIHSDLGCGDDGLVLIAVDAVARMQNDDQLAALLADQVAARLLAHRARLIQESDLIYVGAAVAAGGWVAGAIVEKELQRRLLKDRARMALSYMADAGYDPWQSPEAWRLLAPSHLPKNLSTLKYPGRSKYELKILDLDYKRPVAAAPSAAVN